MMHKKRTDTMTRLMITVLVALLAGNATAQDEGYALLVQQSPPDAGFVTPGDGVHKVGIGQSVSLSAVPKPGYRFLYWLGDVSSVSASDTSIKLDSPKMVVAVFGKEAFDEDLPQAGAMKGQAGAGGGGSLIGNPYPLTGAASVSPGSPVPDQNFPNFPNNPEDPNYDDDFPVPGDEVPEPATVILLGLGAVTLLRKK